MTPNPDQDLSADYALLRLADRLAAIGAFHSAVESAGGGQFCGHCGNRWPCQTSMFVGRTELIQELRRVVLAELNDGDESG